MALSRYVSLERYVDTTGIVADMVSRSTECRHLGLEKLYVSLGFISIIIKTFIMA